MDEIKILRQYAASSQSSPPHDFDVSADVLATLRRTNWTSRRNDDWSASSLRPMMAIATAASLLAISVGLFAQQALADLQDPFGSLFSPFVVTLQ